MFTIPTQAKFAAANRFMGKNYRLDIVQHSVRETAVNQEIADINLGTVVIGDLDEKAEYLRLLNGELLNAQNATQTQQLLQLQAQLHLSQQELLQRLGRRIRRLP